MSADRQPGRAYPGLAILLDIEDPAWSGILPEPAEPEIQRIIEAAAARAGLSVAIETELGVHLVDDEGVRALNAQWRGKDKPTNILSFPMRQLELGEAPGPLMGDLVLARETLEREAIAEGKTAIDHFRHLLVHGTLHLLGHDHDDDVAADAMEDLEILALSDLSVADPYASA